MEASNRPKHVQHLPISRKIQNGNTRVHQGLSDSRGMDVVHRPFRCLPSYPHPPELEEIPKDLQDSQVFQFTSLPFSLATAPQVFTMIVKELKLMAIHQYMDDWLIKAPSQEEAQVNTQTVVDLRVYNQSKEVRTQTHSGVFVCGLRISHRFRPCKTNSREMAQTSLFDPMLNVRTYFDCKVVVTNWVACFNGEDCPRGMPSHETLSVASHGALEISSVIGQPPSLVRDHFSSPRVVANHRQHDKVCTPSPQRPQYPNLYRHLKQRLSFTRRSKKSGKAVASSF